MSVDRFPNYRGWNVRHGFAVQFQKQYPQASCEILEKADNLCGTWWVNTYPGCGCDDPSRFYSFSFALNPNWSCKFTTQLEIAAYLRSVASSMMP